jgi:hypothetical protein
MPNHAPKSPARIEVWRNEVSACEHPGGYPSFQGPIIRQPSFWNKILRRNSKAHGQTEKPTERYAGKAMGKRKESSKEEPESGVRTEMYNGPVKDKVGQLRVDEEGVRTAGSSMDLGSEQSGLEGLRERRERLERAARLLNRSAKKESKDLKDKVIG